MRKSLIPFCLQKSNCTLTVQGIAVHHWEVLSIQIDSQFLECNCALRIRADKSRFHGKLFVLGCIQKRWPKSFSGNQ